MHITEVAPIPGVLTDIVESYKALGLEITIAEMDVISGFAPGSQV
jgi:hypothetical protein